MTLESLFENLIKHAERWENLPEETKRMIHLENAKYLEKNPSGINDLPPVLDSRLYEEKTD